MLIKLILLITVLVAQNSVWAQAKTTPTKTPVKTVDPQKHLNKMCMDQILAGLVDEKILGPESGICVQYNQDANGNIKGLNFSMTSDSFKLGKADVNPDSQAKLAAIKKFVLDYQRVVTKNPKLTIDDINVNIKSYADGVRGPTAYDAEINALATWADVFKQISSDPDSVKYLKEKLLKKNLKTSSVANFDALGLEAKSLIRNVILGQKRSEEICRKLGMKNCDLRPNYGFASPELEAKGHLICDERRVSVISVDLKSAANILGTNKAEYHPPLSIASDNMKYEMQLAASMEMIKRYREEKKKYDDLVKSGTFDTKLKSLQTLKENSLGDEKLKAQQEYDGLVNLKAGNIPYTILPPECRNGPDGNQYANLVAIFSEKYKKLQSDISRIQFNSATYEAYTIEPDGSKKYLEDTRKEDLTKVFTNGDYFGYKRLIGLDGRTAEAVGSFLNYKTIPQNAGGNTTDYFNCFSTAKALQYKFKTDPTTNNLKPATDLLNVSGGELKIKLNRSDVTGHDHTHDRKANWMCHGGCGTGITEGADGSFSTKYRYKGIADKSMNQISGQFGSMPSSFGALKGLSTWVVKNCEDCNCLKDLRQDMDEVLRKNGTQVTINGLNQKNSAKPTDPYFLASVKVEDPATTCIYTPPVAHTCQVDPKGNTNPEGKGAQKPDMSCVVWDKHDPNHGLKWTTNFVKDGLGIANPNVTLANCGPNMPVVKTLEEQAQAAICPAGRIPEDNVIPKHCLKK